MNATACCLSSAMPNENVEIAHGLRRRDPNLLDRLGYVIEDSGDGVRSRVRVGEGGYARFRELQTSDESASVSVFKIHRLVNRPPDPLEDLSEIGRWIYVQGSAPQQHAVKVGVAANYPRHNDSSRGVDNFGPAVFLL